MWRGYFVSFQGGLRKERSSQNQINSVCYTAPIMKNPILNLFKYTFQYSYNQKWRVILFMTLSVFGNLVFLAQPYFISRAFNSVQFSSSDPAVLKHVLMNLGFVALVNLGFWIFHGTSRVLERRFHFIIRKNYKQAMFEKVLDLPASWHKDHHSGETIDKINTAGQALYMFSGRIFFIVQVLVGLIGSMIVLLFFDWRASVIAVAFSTFIILFMLMIDRWLQKQYKILYKFENFFASAIHDYITNIMTIITLKLKKRVITEIDTRGLAGYPTHHRVEFIDEMKWFVNSFLTSVMVVTALMVNALHTFRVEGVIVLGTLFALYGYLQNVGNTFFQFTFRYGEIIRENAAVQAASIIETDYVKLEHTQSETLPETWSMLRVQGLSFTYDATIGDDEAYRKTGLQHLDSIDLDFTQGERVALVGESGSGKSTLLALLRGLYEPQESQLVADGKVLPYGVLHLHSHITLVPQEPEIFNSTIRDNITMGIHVDDDILDQAIDTAQFRSVVERLPQGLETNVLEKGVSLSGGEKQRLALARGILAAQDSDFLFLDEPTSSVDALNEVQIYDNIFSRFSEKTIVSTIHRLHLLSKFDRIYQFEKGKVIASGTLVEMLEQPSFKKLWDKYHREQEG